MNDELHPHDRERQGSGQFGNDTAWGRPLSVEREPDPNPNQELLAKSPEWNRYAYHEGFAR